MTPPNTLFGSNPCGNSNNGKGACFGRRAKIDWRSVVMGSMRLNSVHSSTSFQQIREGETGTSGLSDELADTETVSSGVEHGYGAVSEVLE